MKQAFVQRVNGTRTNKAFSTAIVVYLQSGKQTWAYHCYAISQIQALSVCTKNYKCFHYLRKHLHCNAIFLSVWTINSLIFHFYQSILAIWSKHMGRPMLNSIFFKMILKRHVDQLALNYSKKNNFLKDVACFDLAPWPFHLPLPWRWF